MVGLEGRLLTVGFPDYLMILHVKQEVMGNDMSVLDSVITSDKERLKLLAVAVCGVADG